MLYALVLADGAAEDNPLAGVPGGAAQRVLAYAHGLGRDQDALGVEAVQDVAEALAFLTDAVAVGNEQAVDEDGAESTALRPILGIR